LRTHPRRPSPKRHSWDQLWSLPGDLNRKSEHAPHCRQICSPTPDKSSQFVTNNMIIIPHPPYLLDLNPCDLALFPKLSIKLKGRHSVTVSDIQRESQGVLRQH
jgi:hypothetical protein